MCINCFWHSEQFLYMTCSAHVLQKEELLTKIYLHIWGKKGGFILDQSWLCVTVCFVTSVCNDKITLLNFFNNCSLERLEKKISYLQNLFCITEISSTRIYVIEDRTGRWLLWWMSSLTKTHSIAYACCKFVIIPSTYQVVPRWVEP